MRDGQVIGSWSRTLAKGAAVIETTLLARLERTQQRALDAALERYGAFAGLPVSRA